MSFNLGHDAALAISGQFADGRISEDSVGQHHESLEGLLELHRLQITSELALGDFTVSSSAAPSGDGHLTNKLYVDTMHAIAMSSASDEQTRALAAEADIFEQMAEADSAESTARSAADDALQAGIDAEAAARGAAIDAEAAARGSKDAELEAMINDIISNVDPSAIDSLSEVVSAFQDADGDLNDAMTALLGEHSSALAAAVVDLQAADTAMQADYYSLVATLDAQSQAGDVAAQAALDAFAAEQEDVSASLGEGIEANASAIADEAGARQAADADAAAALADETSAREEAVEAMQEEISTESELRGQGDEGLQAGIEAEEVRAQLAEAANAAAIATEQARATGAEDGISAALGAAVAAYEAADAAEASTRGAAVESLQGDIGTLNDGLAAEVSDRTAALAATDAVVSAYITANDAALATESARAMAAEAAIDARVDDVLSNVDPDFVDSITEVIEAFQSADGEVTEAVNNLIGTHNADVATLESSINSMGDSLSADIAQEATDRAGGDAAVQANLDAWEASHVIGTDTQAYSANLDAMAGGSFATVPVVFSYEAVGAGESMSMGANSYHVAAGAGSTVTLPAGAVAGRKVEVKALGTGFAGSPVSVTGGVVDGSAGFSIAFDYAMLSLISNGDGSWSIC